jgi:hypothetical protein
VTIWQKKNGVPERNAAADPTHSPGMEKASQGDAIPIAFIGASPFQTREAQPFPAIPYRPHTIDLFWPFDPSTGLRAQDKPLGSKARRCYEPIVQEL